MKNIIFIRFLIVKVKNLLIISINERFIALGWACVLSGSWRGNGPPSLRRVAGVRARPARGGLRHGPHSYGRQQLRILHNGRKSDAATPRDR